MMLDSQVSKKEIGFDWVYTVYPTNTECFHLCMRLHEGLASISFEDLKSVNSVV